jgi:hypothetical protein
MRQRTSAYVSIRQRTSACHTSAYVSMRQHTTAYVSIRQHTSAYHTSAYHTSAYVSIRQIGGGYQQQRVAGAQKKKNQGKEKINILPCPCLFKAHVKRIHALKVERGDLDLREIFRYTSS